MVGESMPERLWLGASLPSNQTNSHRTLVRTLNARGKAQELVEIIRRRWLAYSPVTSLSGEQVTVVQLQGSTESLSQFLSTPWGSMSRFLIVIRACTVK